MDKELRDTNRKYHAESAEIDAETLDRRRFILSLSGSFAALIAQGCGSRTKSEVETKTVLSTDDIIKNIPDEFNGAKIEKHSVEGATAVIIHVADLHNDPAAADPQKIRNASDLVQAENVAILEMLMDNCKTNVVFKEVVTKDNKFILRKRIAEIQALHQAVETCTDATQKEKLGGKFMEDIDELKYALGAAGFLAFQGKAQLEAAETTEGNSLTKEEQLDPAKKFDRRENIAINLALSNTESAAKIIVYGENHGFHQRIREWNEKHPGQKCAHIKITPAILHQWLRESGRFQENK
ncbi:MAG: hypothetical protein JWM56_282 [Candidatus Peribacteria bacterium]|nr:hypothetical protein [Candidatus Peribacteria bacterium]